VLIAVVNFQFKEIAGEMLNILPGGVNQKWVSFAWPNNRCGVYEDCIF